MSKPRDVGQQNAEAKAKILRAMGAFDSQSGLKTWLRPALENEGVLMGAGILVALSELPDQGGNLFQGIWLTPEKQFWSFSILVSRESNAVVEIERLENITTSTAISAHVPGTGRSFGHLAIEVLEESRDG
jgi:hypothetical protein